MQCTKVPGKHRFSLGRLKVFKGGSSIRVSWHWDLCDVVVHRISPQVSTECLERPQLWILAVVLAYLLPYPSQSHQQNLGVSYGTVFPAEAEVSCSSAQVCVCISVQHRATKSGLEHRVRLTLCRQTGEPWRIPTDIREGKDPLHLTAVFVLTCIAEMLIIGC